MFCLQTHQRLIMGKNVVVLGSQWGDEGKGKIVDLLTEKASAVARFLCRSLILRKRSRLKFSRYSCNTFSARIVMCCMPIKFELVLVKFC